MINLSISLPQTNVQDNRIGHYSQCFQESQAAQAHPVKIHHQHNHPPPPPKNIVSGAIQDFSPQADFLSCKVINGNVQTYRFALVSLLSSDSLGGGERGRMRTSHGR